MFNNGPELAGCQGELDPSRETEYRVCQNFIRYDDVTGGSAHGEETQV